MLQTPKRGVRRFGGRWGKQRTRQANLSRFQEVLNDAYGETVQLADPGPLPPDEQIAATLLLRQEDLQRQATEDVYFANAYATVADIVLSLRMSGKDVKELHEAYEFGCGTGRLIRHLRSLPGVRLKASDARLDTIECCEENLPGIEFHHNELEPGLGFMAADLDHWFWLEFRVLP